MLLPRRPSAVTLLAVLVLPAARAAGETCATDTTAPTPCPTAAALENPRKIEWRDVFWGDRFGRVLHAPMPYQNGRLLEGETLYLALDRPDLAVAYRKREQTLTNLAVAGGFFVLGGMMGGAIAAAGADHRIGDGTSLAIGALISTILGAGLWVAGSCVPAFATRAELQHLVDVHNNSL